MSLRNERRSKMFNYCQSDRDQEIHDTFFVSDEQFDEHESDMLDLQFKLGTSI